MELFIRRKITYIIYHPEPIYSEQQNKKNLPKEINSETSIVQFKNLSRKTSAT